MGLCGFCFGDLKDIDLCDRKFTDSIMPQYKRFYSTVILLHLDDDSCSSMTLYRERIEGDVNMRKHYTLKITATEKRGKRKENAFFFFKCMGGRGNYM